METLDNKLEEANILLKELIKDNFRKDDKSCFQFYEWELEKISY